MAEPDEVALGWTVSERVPDLSDYEPRGGVVTDVHRTRDDQAAVVGVAVAKVVRGHIQRADLLVEQIDWSLAQRPRAVAITPVVLTMTREAVTGTRTLAGWRLHVLLQAAELAKLL